MAKANVNLYKCSTVPNKIAKILEIFDRLEELKDKGFVFFLSNQISPSLAINYQAMAGGIKAKLIAPEGIIQLLRKKNPLVNHQLTYSTGF